MKRAFLPVLMIIPFFLSACGDAGALEDAFLESRERLAAAEKITLEAEVTAELYDSTFECSLKCSRENGEYTVEVLKPENISGIRAKMSEEESLLEYDGLILALPDPSPGSASPLEALPLLTQALIKGHLSSIWRESEGEQSLAAAQLYISESDYAQIWMDTEKFIPRNMELVSGGRAVVKCKIVSFTEE